MKIRRTKKKSELLTRGEIGFESIVRMYQSDLSRLEFSAMILDCDAVRDLVFYLNQWLAKGDF